MSIEYDHNLTAHPFTVEEVEGEMVPIYSGDNGPLGLDDDENETRPLDVPELEPAKKYVHHSKDTFVYPEDVHKEIGTGWLEISRNVHNPPRQ